MVGVQIRGWRQEKSASKPSYIQIGNTYKLDRVTLENLYVSLARSEMPTFTDFSVIIQNFTSSTEVQFRVKNTTEFHC